MTEQLVVDNLFQERMSGGGGADGRDLSSGKGMNVSLSFGGSTIRPCFQSSLACSIRSWLLDTKFHHIYRSPSGSHPSSIKAVSALEIRTGSAPLINTSN